MLQRSIILLAVLLSANMAWGAEPQPAPAKELTPEQFEAQLSFREGTIELPGKIATLRLDKGFRYLSPEDTERVLVEAWGNPPGNESLGMIFPPKIGPYSEDGFAVIVNYDEDGYVSEDDADNMNYAKLLEKMKEDSKASNEERVKAGYKPVSLVGWAEQPSYDKSVHKFYWAKELKFGDDAANTLNYNVRILGRKGVLVMNAVSGMGEMENVRREMKSVLAFTEFNPGFRYADFDPKMDKMAGYGLAALVAGGVAAKMGLFAKLGVFLLAAKKFILIAIVAIGIYLKRLFSRKTASPPTPS